MIRKGEYPSFYLVELVSFYFKFTMKGYKPAPVKRHPRDVLRLHRAERDQHAGRGGGAVFQLNPFGILILPEQPSTIGCLAFVQRPSMMPFTIVGNIQQRSTERIGFVPSSC
jgi:hypothetical protein